MRRTSIVRDSTFVAIALGFAVFSSTATPASALSLSQFGANRVTELNQHTPAPNNNTVANQLLNKSEPQKAQLPPPQVAQGSSNLINHEGPWKVLPVGGAQNQQPSSNPPVHVCPLNHPCPPLPTPTGNGTGTGSANGNGTGNANGNGGTNVTVNLPPVVIGRPAPVYVAPPQPVYIAQPQMQQMMPRPSMPQMPMQARPTMPQSQPVAPVQTAAATQPTNCLTKQYLSDGSALFSDTCTGETAMASAAQLQAEAQARQPQTSVPQAQVSNN